MSSKLAAYKYRRAAVAAGFRNGLAITVSEILFAMQLSPDNGGEDSSVSFTGSRLHDLTGCHPRTFNRHVAKLVKEGWFTKSVGKPPFGNAVQVTWLSLTEKSKTLVAYAKAISEPETASEHDVLTDPAKVAGPISTKDADASVQTAPNYTKKDSKKKNGDYMAAAGASASPSLKHNDLGNASSAAAKVQIAAMRSLISEACVDRGQPAPQYEAKRDDAALAHIAQKLARKELSNFAQRMFLGWLIDTWKDRLALLPENYQKFAANSSGPTHVAINKACGPSLKLWLEQIPCQE